MTLKKIRSPIAFRWRNAIKTPENMRRMKQNLVTSLVKHDRIITTLPRAKMILPYANRIIDLAKNGTKRSERRIDEFLYDETAKDRLRTELLERYAEESSFYTVITPLGTRSYDKARMAVVEYRNGPSDVRQMMKKFEEMVREKVIPKELIFRSLNRIEEEYLDSQKIMHQDIQTAYNSVQQILTNLSHIGGDGTVSIHIGKRTFLPKTKHMSKQERHERSLLEKTEEFKNEASEFELYNRYFDRMKALRDLWMHRGGILQSPIHKVYKDLQESGVNFTKEAISRRSKPSGLDKWIR